MHVHKNIVLASKQVLDNGKEDSYIDLCIDKYFIINLLNLSILNPPIPTPGDCVIIKELQNP